MPDHPASTRPSLEGIELKQRVRKELEEAYGKPPYDALIELHVEPVCLPDLGATVWIDAIADVTKREGVCGPDPELHDWKVIEIGEGDRVYQPHELSVADDRVITDAVEREAWHRIG